MNTPTSISMTRRLAMGALLCSILPVSGLGGCSTTSRRHSVILYEHGYLDVAWKPSLKLKQPYEGVSGSALYLTAMRYRTVTKEWLQINTDDEGGLFENSDPETTSTVVDAWLMRIDLANGLAMTKFRSLGEQASAHPRESPAVAGNEEQQYFGLSRGNSPYMTVYSQTSTSGRYTATHRALTGTEQGNGSELITGARQLDIIENSSRRTVATLSVDEGLALQDPVFVRDSVLLVSAESDAGDAGRRLYIVNLPGGQTRYLERVTNWELIEGTDVLIYRQEQGAIWEDLARQIRLDNTIDHGLRIKNRILGYKDDILIDIDLNTMTSKTVKMPWTPERLFGNESSSYVGLLGHVGGDPDTGASYFRVCGYNLNTRALRCTSVTLTERN